MVTQSFTDFVQENEAATQNGIPDRELQRLIALARIGGPEGDAAVRMLERIPGGLQALSGQALPNISQQIQRRIEEPLPREYETGYGVAETPTGFIPREAEMLKLPPGLAALGAAGELVADPGKAIAAGPLEPLGTEEYDVALAQEHERIRQQEGDETNPFGRFLRNIEASMMAQDAPGVSQSFPQWTLPNVMDPFGTGRTARNLFGLPERVSGGGWTTIGGLEALQATGELAVPGLGLAPKHVLKPITYPVRQAVRGAKAAARGAKPTLAGVAKIADEPLTPGVDDPVSQAARETSEMKGAAEVSKTKIVPEGQAAFDAEQAGTERLAEHMGKRVASGEVTKQQAEEVMLGGPVIPARTDKLRKIVPADIPKAAGIPKELVEDLPDEVLVFDGPSRSTVVTKGPKGTDGVAKEIKLGSIQSAQREMDVRFHRDVMRVMGEKLGWITKLFDQGLSGVRVPRNAANEIIEGGEGSRASLAKRLLIVYAGLHTEGLSKANRAFAEVLRYGTVEDIFGKLDAEKALGSTLPIKVGGLVERTFRREELIMPEVLKGKTLNEIAEAAFDTGPYAKTYDPRVRAALQNIPIRGTDGETALDYMATLNTLDRLATDYVNTYGGGIIKKGESHVIYAGRRIWGKLNKDGEVVHYDVLKGDIPAGAFSKDWKKAATYNSAEEARNAGYVLLPYDEAVKLKLREATKTAAEEEIEKYLLKHYDLDFRPVEKIKSGKQKGELNYAEVQASIYRKALPVTEEAKAIQDEFNKALDNYLKTKPENIMADMVAAYNDVGRSFELAGDASVFGIQLFLPILGDTFVPIRGTRGIERLAATSGLGKIPLRVEVPGKLLAKSTVAFVNGFVRGLFDPARARAFNAKMIADNSDDLVGTRSLIISMPGEVPELAAGLQRVQNLDDLFGFAAPTGTTRRGILKGALLPLTRIAAAGQEGFVAAQNAASIYLWQGLKSSAEEAVKDTAGNILRNADGTIRTKTNPKKLLDIEDNISAMTGKISTERLGISGKQRWRESAVLLASRYRRAVLAQYKNALQGGVRGKIAREHLIRGIVGLHMAGIAIVIGKSISEGKSKEGIMKEVRATITPGSSSYFGVQIGDTVIGFGGKTISDIRFLSKLFNQATSEREFTHVFERWIRGQIAFAGQFLWNQIEGRDFMGAPVGYAAKDEYGEVGQLPFRGEKGWGRGFATEGLRTGMFIWLQSALLDGGTFTGRLRTGAAEFFGGRGYPVGSSGYLKNAAEERYGVSYDDDDFNQLMRAELLADPEVGLRLQGFTEEAAHNGQEWARFQLKKDEERESTKSDIKFAMDTLAIELTVNADTKSKTGKPIEYGNVYNIVRKFSTEYSKLKYGEYRYIELLKKERGFGTYIGEEPTNDFDRMLNEWYAISDNDKFKNKRGEIDWEKLEKAQDEFKEKLSPSLREDLETWTRRNNVPGSRELRDLLDPNIKMTSQERFTAASHILKAAGYTREGIAEMIDEEQEFENEKIANQ
jgi:hypothetical protein